MALWTQLKVGMWVLVQKQENIWPLVKVLALRNNNKKREVFIFGPEQSGQSFSRRNPVLSSAKVMIYLFQKADGLQAISVHRAGEQDVPACVKGQSCRAEWQRKGELSLCLQVKLSFSCTTILVHLFFYSSSWSTLVVGRTLTVCPSQGEGGMGEGELGQRCVLFPLPMDSKKSEGLIYQRKTTV